MTHHNDLATYTTSVHSDQISDIARWILHNHLSTYGSTPVPGRTLTITHHHDETLTVQLVISSPLNTYYHENGPKKSSEGNQTKNPS